MIREMPSKQIFTVKDGQIKKNLSPIKAMMI